MKYQHMQNNQLRQWLFRCVLTFAIAAWGNCCPRTAVAEDRTITLCLVAEDMSPHSGCYFDQAIQTPNFNWLAKCFPSRRLLMRPYAAPCGQPGSRHVPDEHRHPKSPQRLGQGKNSAPRRSLACSAVFLSGGVVHLSLRSVGKRAMNPQTKI